MVPPAARVGLAARLTRPGVSVAGGMGLRPYLCGYAQQDEKSRDRGKSGTIKLITENVVTVQS